MSRMSATRRKGSLEKLELPLVPVGAAWGAIGAIFLAVSGSGDSWILRVGWFGAVWAFCVLDLIFMVKALASVVHLMTETRTDRRPARIIQVMFWGALKLLCLGAIGYLVYVARGKSPSASLWTGVATIVIVPLVAGFWWSRRQLREGS